MPYTRFFDALTWSIISFFLAPWLGPSLLVWTYTLYRMLFVFVFFDVWAMRIKIKIKKSL